jgi:hypothetical protein
MLPTVGTDTLKICWYAGEVVGRARGVARMENLVPTNERRATINASADTMATALTTLANAYVARVVYEFVQQRIALGVGRGVDRGFDALISSISEAVRTSLPDRNVRNPDYRQIFPNGAEEFTSPTIKEDEALATDLRQSVSDSNLAVKADILSQLDAVIPIVSDAAGGLRDGEKQVNALFQAELNGRKLVVDALWEQRKAIELALGRGGRQLARFVFFDVRKGSAEAPVAEPDGDEGADGGAPGGDPGAPKGGEPTG